MIRVLRQRAIMATSEPTAGKVRKTYKILVLGDMNVGKTNLVKRYVHGSYKIEQPTIGCDRLLKVLDWDAKTEVRLQLLDTAGQERFKSLSRQYYREAAGCLLIFDITCPDSLDSIVGWKCELDEYAGDGDASTPCVLLANKCDLVDEQNRVDSASLDKFCRENGIVHWFLASAKDNINIESAFKFLIYDMMLKEKEQTPLGADAGQTVNLGQLEPEGDAGCC